MENELKAPAAGVVHVIRAIAGAAVEKGSVLWMDLIIVFLGVGVDEYVELYWFS